MMFTRLLQYVVFQSAATMSDDEQMSERWLEWRHVRVRVRVVRVV